MERWLVIKHIHVHNYIVSLVSLVPPLPPPFYTKPLYSSEPSQYLPTCTFLYIGSCINHLVVHLKDFTTRYPSPKSWYSSSSTPLQLFVCHTYFGLCLHGELRCVYSMIRGIPI